MNFYDGYLALLSSITFMAGGALLLGVAVFIALASLWWLGHEPAPGSLGALFAREGIDWARLAAAASVDEFALGLSRCTECRAKAECGEWLASGRRDGYQSFCPNAAFVERVTKVAMR
jgi:hypothetical protein